MSLQVVYETHATTVDNERGFATGWQPGELSASGRSNAAALGRRRRADGLDLVVCSDLARAVETVRIAFGHGELPVRQDVRLREVDYGAMTGAPVADIERQRRDRVDEPFPGGQSYREVAGGVDLLLEELLEELDGGRVLLVGHAATRYALDHLLTGRPLATAVAGPFRWREGWTWTVSEQRPAATVLTAAEAADVVDELVEVYRAAFWAPGAGDEDVERFARHQLPAHLGRGGFRCATIREQGRLLAFGYGYLGRSGQWWTDHVRSAAPDDVARTWMAADHFEVAELAVRPELQAHGLGTAVHDLLLQDAPADRALLTATTDRQAAAPRLYEALGWQRLADRVFDDSDLYGLDLRGWRG